MFGTFSVSAPGKILLSGEHAVVYNTTAVAATVDKRTTLVCSPAEIVRLSIQHQQMTVTHEWKLEDLQLIVRDCISQPGLVVPKPDEVHAIKKKLEAAGATDPSPLAFLLIFCALYGAATGVDCVVSSELPMGAGLGSSASYCVTVAGCFVYLAHLRAKKGTSKKGSVGGGGGAVEVDLNDDERGLINNWAFAGEQVIHGNPSGVDNTVVTFGGALSFKRGVQPVILGQLPETFRFIITNTRVERDTSKLVARVKELRDDFPDVVNPVISSIDGLANTLIGVIQSMQKPESKQALSLPSLESKAGVLLSMNQHLLTSLRVGHHTIDQVVALGNKYGFNSKLTGAGGGGCVISLIPRSVSQDSIEEFCKASQGLGFESFQAAIGQGGVRIQNNNSAQL